MAISNYQSNVIKQVYGDEIINQKNVTTNEVENYYKYNSNYNNSIESPDLLTIISSYHGFSTYTLQGTRTTSLPNNVISKIGIPKTIVDSHSAYFKLVDEKDIDWENAYLRYSENNFNNCNPQKIEYITLNTESTNNDIQLTYTKFETEEYTFDRNITSYINNSYDLLNTIDYLLSRIKTLYFLYNVVKDQSIVMGNYKEQKSKINS